VIAVWLVVTVALVGKAPVLLTDSREPSLESCLAHASELLERASKVRGDDGFEFAVSCSVVKAAEMPAHDGL
jgi:hypothetical protein